MSSPNINSVLLVGCMITYSTVLLQSSESLIGNTLCKVLFRVTPPFLTTGRLYDNILRCLSPMLNYITVLFAI